MFLHRVKKETRAHIAVLVTNLFFAANFSFVKLISPVLVRPFGLNVFRVGISLALFWIVWSFGNTSAKIDKKDWWRFILCGLTGVAINQTFFIKGLTMTSTVHASLLLLTTPLLITVFALWILKERLTTLKAIGLLLGVSGCILLILSKEMSNEASYYLLGDLFIFINAVSYSLYFILVKPLMERYSPLHVVRWVFTIGFFMILPFGWHEAATTPFYAMQPEHLLALLGVIFTGTFLAYYFNAYGIQHLGASVTGSYIYLQPVFAVVLAFVLLDEKLSLEKVIAAFLIFGGVFLVNYNKQEKLALARAPLDN